MILAIKTADLTTQLWLYSDAASAKPVASHDWESGRSLSEQILMKISSFLQDNGATLAGLTGIVIYSGPGSFTSLRIGHAVGNALADSLLIPVVGAAGEQWLPDALQALADTPPGRPALPHYGSEAHITRRNS